MKKFLLLLTLFISLFTLTNTKVNAEYIPTCDLDVSQKMDWAAGFFQPNQRNIKISDLSTTEKEVFFGKGTSLFSGAMNLTPRLYYNDAIGCEGKTKKIEILGNNDVNPIEISTLITDDLDQRPTEITYQQESAPQINLRDICTHDESGNNSKKFNCSLRFRAKDKNNVDKISPTLTFDYVGNINGKQIHIYPEYSFKRPPKSTTTECKLGPEDISFSTENGDFDLNEPKIKGQIVTLKIKTKKKCDDILIGVSFLNEAGINTDVEIENTSATEHWYGEDDYIVVKSYPHKDLWLNFSIQEDGCSEDSTELDCRIITRIYSIKNEKELDKLIAKTSSPSGDDVISWKKNGNLSTGILGAECDDLCDLTNNAWKLIKTNGKAPFNTGEEVAPSSHNNDKSSPCYDKQTGKYKENCYEFLAPIKGIEINPNTEQVDKNFKVTTDGRIAIRDVRKYELGDYINKIFQLAISILGILSVIMIIVAGVEYMTVESIYGKSAAKQRIIGAVTGLMLSLGIFVILNTINPQLLQINFGSNLSIASVDEKPTQNKDGSYNINSSHGSTRKFKVNGILQKKGMPWKPENTDSWETLRKESNINESIINNVYINKAECSKIGNSCTSTYFDEQSFNTIKSGLEKLQKDCGCKLTISGGSEFWFHKTHGPNSTKIDISNQMKFGVKKQDLEKLAKTLTNNTYSSLRGAINSGKYKNRAVDYLKYVNIYAEDGDHLHWHLTFK